MSLTNKIDFAVVFSVKNANPNGDPLNGNRPRTTMDGRGEISDVCLKRKIRNRLMDLGENVFVQSDDKNLDSYRSLKDRADACAAFKNEKDKEKAAAAACKVWFDVRAFGQVFAFKNTGGAKGEGVSIGVRGPVSIHPAISVDPIFVNEMQITKSVNSVTGDKKSSDTMGTKNTVDLKERLMAISITEAAELKKAILDNFGVTLHFHDGCGGQYFTLDERNDEIKRFIESYFDKKGMTVTFIARGTQFSVGGNNA